MKEISISIVIIMIIVSFDLITQNYTSNAVDDITNQLEHIKNNINGSVNREELLKQAKQIRDNWRKKNEKMAFYIEHDELEKVETNITSMISYIESEEYKLALNQIEINIFVLEHIKDKYQLELENIF